MTLNEFTIVASGLDPTADDYEQRFYEAGCDDATVSFQKGYTIVDFAREAESFDLALASALAAVVSTGAQVERIEPDPLVSLSDIASRSGLTRAAMTNYSKGHRGRDFPSPVARVTSESPLYDWAAVAEWLYRMGRMSREVVIVAELVKFANTCLQRGEIPTEGHLASARRKYEQALH